MRRSLATQTTQAGFSLLELVIVCGIISIVAALALASFANRDQAGRFQADVAARLRERRASAIRINALTEPTLLENFRQPPIGIDFTNLATTAPLVVEGDNHTTFSVPRFGGGTAKWEFVYQGIPLQIPSGWRVATGAGDLSQIPLIPLGALTTTFAFTSDGKLDASSLPAYTSNTNPNNENPFPTLYLTNGSAARAVAVHPSGLVELWNYDETTGKWTGFSNRQVTATPTPTPVPSPTPTPTPGPCSIGASPNPILIPKNGQGTVVITLWGFNGKDVITAKSSSKLEITPASQEVFMESSATFTINVQTLNGSVNFSSPCGSTNLKVTTF